MAQQCLVMTDLQWMTHCALSPGEVWSWRVVGGFSLLRQKRRHPSGYYHPRCDLPHAGLHCHLCLLLPVRQMVTFSTRIDTFVFVCVCWCLCCVHTAGGRVSRQSGSTRRWSTSWRIWRKVSEIAARKSSQVSINVFKRLFLVAPWFYWLWYHCALCNTNMSACSCWLGLYSIVPQTQRRTHAVNPPRGFQMQHKLVSAELDLCLRLDYFAPLTVYLKSCQHDSAMWTLAQTSGTSPQLFLASSMDRFQSKSDSPVTESAGEGRRVRRLCTCQRFTGIFNQRGSGSTQSWNLREHLYHVTFTKSWALQ